MQVDGRDRTSWMREEKRVRDEENVGDGGEEEETQWEIRVWLYKEEGGSGCYPQMGVTGVQGGKLNKLV